MYLFLTAADSTGAAGGGASVILMFVVLIAVFYFFMIRPENKRKKEAQQMRDSLKVGDNITTIGGIIGDIVSIKDDSIVIETTTDRVRVEFAKFAVSTNNTAEKEAAKQKAAALAARKEQKEKEKKAKKDNYTLFIDATKECIKITNSNKLTEENIQHILDIFTDRKDVQYISKLVANDEIAKSEYNLSVSTYVEQEDTREKVDIVNLNAELAEIVSRENVLRSEIDKIIKEIEI